MEYIDDYSSGENSFIDEFSYGLLFINSELESTDYADEEREKAPRIEPVQKKRAVSNRIDFEDMKALCFSRDQLLSYLPNVFFDEIVRNGFILHRETIGDQQIYLIRQIRDVKESKYEYYVGNIATVKVPKRFTKVKRRFWS